MRERQRDPVRFPQLSSHAPATPIHSGVQMLLSLFSSAATKEKNPKKDGASSRDRDGERSRMSVLHEAVKSPMSLCVQVFVPLVSGALDCFGLEALPIFLPLCYRHTGTSSRFRRGGARRGEAGRGAAPRHRQRCRLSVAATEQKKQTNKGMSRNVVVAVFLISNRKLLGSRSRTASPSDTDGASA